jgi:aspartate carbamoyltransferase regulatory subunit
MEYITNIIGIIKPSGIINIIDNQTIIEYQGIKLIHTPIDKQLVVLSTFDPFRSTPEKLFYFI